MANNVLEEKFPFLQEGVFLIAQVNAMTGQQRLLMQKVDPRTGQVLIKDAINCIHVAVGNIPPDEFEATADAADFPEDVLRIRSSEKLKEISLAPEERFQAFKSWVAGIAEAGLDAFKLQRDIEVAGKLAYPIVNRIMTFAVKVDPTLLTEHIENIVRECQHEGTHHVASLTANILPIV